MSLPGRRSAAVLTLLLATGLAAATPVAHAAPPRAEVASSSHRADRSVEAKRDVVHPEVERRLQGASKDSRVKVIVSLDVRRSGAAPRRADVRSASDEVVQDLPRGSYAVRSRFDRIPALSLAVDTSALRALARNPRVTAVNEDHTISLEMDEANALAGVTPVHGGGITGEGVVVAVIDSGVDSDAGVVHPGLADDMIGQACFRTENDCIGGASSAEDQGGHGTHVAGIITGPGGAAPDAQFHALKVFTTGDTSDTNILNALNHVIGLNTTTPGAVDLVNMSLGGGAYGTQASCDSANTAYVSAFSTLNAQGTAVFVSTGNGASTSSVAAPGCVSGAVGVGSVGDGNHAILFGNCTDNGAPDKVSCFSNTTPVQGAGELVDVLAPGCSITSTWLNGGTNAICGTSMASPFAAGVAALVLETAAASGTSLTPASLEQLLEDTGVQLSDYRLPSESPTFPRVDASAAVGTMTIDAPGNLQAVQASTTSVSLTWDGVVGADDYRVFRTSNGTGETLVATTVATGAVDTAVPCGPLTYVVRASEDGLLSLPSGTATVQARPCPAAPSGLALTRTGPTSHQLTWTENNLNETAVVLQRRLPGESFTDLQVLAADTSSTTDTVPTCGVVEYRVMSVRSGDRSLPSNVVRRAMCAPLNDDLADAEVVTPGLSGSSVSDTEAKVPFATRDASDPEFTCKFTGQGPGYHTIWYAITPSAPVRATIDTAGSTLIDPATDTPDTLLAVYRGTPSVLTQAACSEDISSSDFRSRLSLNLDVGHTYYVQVAQWSELPEAQTGNVVTTFAWSDPLPVPAIDEWTAAAAIDPTPYTLSVGNAQQATVSGYDPVHPCRAEGADVGNHTLWWTFTPEFDGALDVDTLASTGSFDDTILSIWTGEPGSFASVACNDDVSGSNLRSRLLGVPLSGGTTYSIQVSRWSPTPTTSAGTVVLNADYSVTPAVVVSPTEVAVSEDGQTDTYAVRLTTEPIADVVVAVTGDEDCLTDRDELTFTATNWSSPQSVTVAAAKDTDDSEGTHACLITHEVASDDPAYGGLAVPDVTGTVTDRTLRIGRPDARIKQGTTLIGDNVYGGPTLQTASKRVRAGKKVTFAVTVQNDAEVAERLRVLGTKPSAKFKVTYRTAAGDVTQQVRAGTLLTPKLAPGATFAVTVVVAPTKKATKGSKIRGAVTAFSTAVPTAKDTVGFLVRRR